MTVRDLDAAVRRALENWWENDEEGADDLVKHLTEELGDIRRDERNRLADLFESEGLALFDYAKDKGAMLGLLVLLLRLDSGAGQATPGGRSDD